jgi:hypothetical protein
MLPITIFTKRLDDDLSFILPIPVKEIGEKNDFKKKKNN